MRVFMVCCELLWKFESHLYSVAIYVYVCVCVQFTQSKLTQSLLIVASNNHDSDRHYGSALPYTHMHMHISVATIIAIYNISR